MNGHLTVKDLPETEKPYEKCLMLGASSLSDAELLAVIIRTGSKGEKSIDLAYQILNMAGGNGGIVNIANLSLKDLMSIKGIGTVKAVQIQCITEISKRFSKSKAFFGICLNSPQSIADYYMQDLRHKKQEEMILAMFDTKNHFIGDRMISKGTVNASLVSPREIFIEALKSDAVYIVLLHNHPSGDVTPSREDILITKRITECGSLIGISVLDHIIIGDNRYLSFNEKGLL